MAKAVKGKIAASPAKGSATIGRPSVSVGGPVNPTKNIMPGGERPGAFYVNSPMPKKNRALEGIGLSVPNPSKVVRPAPMMPIAAPKPAKPVKRPSDDIPKRAMAKRVPKPGEKGTEEDLFSGKVKKKPPKDDKPPTPEEPLPPGAATQAMPQPTAIRPASNRWNDIVGAYFPSTGGNVYKKGGLVKGAGCAKRGVRKARNV